jgi:hypothetical protein
MPDIDLRTLQTLQTNTLRDSDSDLSTWLPAQTQTQAHTQTHTQAQAQSPGLTQAALERKMHSRMQTQAQTQRPQAQVQAQSQVMQTQGGPLGWNAELEMGWEMPFNYAPFVTAAAGAVAAPGQTDSRFVLNSLDGDIALESCTTYQ